MENSAHATAATGHTNRLIHEQSPYLLQHAHNPVDWYAWGEEAFAAAAAQDKPIFLSIGYSTCHWCHVMERESFENAGVAELLNRDFVAIKVDREERPEIDDLYMSATQMLTGQGGWPNSVWLTPDGRPFFAGTYFPPEDMGERPGFKSVLTFLAHAWRDKRLDVLAQAAQVSAAVGQVAAARSALPAGAKLDRQIVHDVLDAHHRNFDFRLGGFGSAPKFPPHALLGLLAYEMLRHRTEMLSDMLGWTLEAMARGGIRDHLGGGFHRYSTDARWLVPHFEKMLYDNALLLRSYADAADLMPERSPIFVQAADDIVAWLAREMTGAQGGFYSALDADSEGEEGKYYLWTRQEIIDELGESEGELFCRVYNVREEGNFDDPATGVPSGRNILHLGRPIADSAKIEGLDEASLQERLSAARERLLTLRGRRIRPGLDDKIMTSWNALAITGLCYAGVKLDRPAYIQMAIRAAEFVLSALRPHDRLGHIYRDGEKHPPAVRGASTAGASTATAKQEGYLEDYAYLAGAMLELYRATSERRWLGEAVALAEAMRELFADPAGGFYFTAADQPILLARIRSPFDSATPSPNGVACLTLIGLAEATGEKAYWLAAWGCLLTFGALLAQRSQGVETLTLALAEFLDRCPQEIQKECQDQRPQPAGQVVSGPVRLAVFPPAGAVKPGDRVELELHMAIEPPWHVGSHDASSENYVPTEVALEETPLATLGQVQYPQGVIAQLAQSGEPVSIYRGSATFRLPIDISPQAKPGPLEMAIVVRFQACDERSCQRPTQLSASLSVTIG